MILVGVGFGLLLYLFGVVANVFDLAEMRSSDEAILEELRMSPDTNAFVGTAAYLNGLISFASVGTSTASDSVAVIFVHGSPGSMDAYTIFLLDPHLQAHASLYTYDRLDYGNSTRGNSDLSLIPQSNQLYALVKHIGARQNIFVGHSLGCSIIARFAMDYPELTQGLVMVAAPIDPALEPSSWWRPILEFPMISIAMPHAFRISNRELKPLKTDLEACLPLWERVRCPVTFIHGDIDKLVPVENVAFGKKMLQNSEQVREIILEKHGHFILWTHEQLIVDEIVEMIEDF